MAHQVTENDIIDALQGRSSPSVRTTDDNVVEALRSGRSPKERNTDDDVVQALEGSSYVRPAFEDELPLLSRGDDLEAINIWAAEEAAQTAAAKFAQALMRAAPEKGIYTAESEARAAAKEAYREAARTSPFELDRQQAVTKHLCHLTESAGPHGGDISVR